MIDSKLQDIKKSMTTSSAFSSRRASALNVRHSFETYDPEDEQNIDTSLDRSSRMLLASLKEVRLFQQLPMSQCMYLMKHGSRRKVKKGEALFEQGDSGEAFFTILKGAVAVFKKLEEGTPEAAPITKVRKYKGETILPHTVYGPCVNVMQPGQHFGEMALVTEANRRHASVVGLDRETHLFTIDKTAYNRVLRRNMNIFHVADNYYHLLGSDGDIRSPTDIQILVQLTKQHSVFHQLPDFIMEKLCRYLYLQSCHRGTFVYFQGDEINDRSTFNIILSGSVSVHIRSQEVAAADKVVYRSERRVSMTAEGEEPLEKKERRSSLLTPLNYDDLEMKFGKCVSTLHEGDSFGEMAFLSSAPRDCTIICRQDARLMTVLKKDFTNAMSNLDFDQKLLFMPEKIMQLLHKVGADRTEDDLNAVVSMTRHIKFFNSMPLAQHKDICKVMKCEKLRADEVIVQQGDPGDAFFIILTGHVSVHYIPSKNLDENLSAGEERRDRLTVEQFYGPSVKLLGKGDSFGELALLKGEPRNATVITLEPTDLIVLGKNDYEKTMKVHVAEQLKKKIAALQEIPLLKGLNKIELTKMTYYLQEKTFAAGSTVTEQGGAPKGIYFILEGGCKAVYHDPAINAPLKLTLLGKGEFCGAEASVFEDAIEPCSVQTVSETTFYFIPLQDVVAAFDGPFLAILKRIAKQKLEFQEHRLATIKETKEKLKMQFGPKTFRRRVGQGSGRPPSTSLPPSPVVREIRQASGRSLTPTACLKDGAKPKFGGGSGGGRPVKLPPATPPGPRAASGPGGLHRPNTTAPGARPKSVTYGIFEKSPVPQSLRMTPSPRGKWGPPGRGGGGGAAGFPAAPGSRESLRSQGRSSTTRGMSRKSDRPDTRATARGGTPASSAYEEDDTPQRFYNRPMTCDVDLRSGRSRGEKGVAGCVRLVCGSLKNVGNMSSGLLSNEYTKSRQLNDYTRNFVSKLRSTDHITASY